MLAHEPVVIWYGTVGDIGGTVVAARSNERGSSRGRFDGDFFYLADNLMLVDASLHNVSVDGFSLTARDRDVLLGTRGAPRLTIALPEMPGIEGVSASPTRLEELNLEAHGLDVQADRPVDVDATPDSVIDRLVPSTTNH